MNRFAVKFLLVSCMLALFFSGGCKEKPKNPVAEYGNALIHSYQKSEKAADIANLDAIRKAVQRYRVEHEKYPESLSDIEDLAGITIDTGKYEYDSATGKVALRAE